MYKFVTKFVACEVHVVLTLILSLRRFRTHAQASPASTIEPVHQFHLGMEHTSALVIRDILVIGVK